MIDFTGGFIKKTASGNAISTGGSGITASGNGDFHWPLALAALKNASENVSRTATIEALCTSGESSGDGVTTLTYKLNVMDP